MARRNEICEIFNSTVLDIEIGKKYKNYTSFAKRLGVSFQSVYAWINGDKFPTWRNVIRIASILNVPARKLIIPNKRYILKQWEKHLIQYLEAPPELKHQTKEETRVGDDGGSEIHSETKTKRELKLTAKEALELTDLFGYFDDADGVHADGESSEDNIKIRERFNITGSNED